jgi:RNA polymerase sigma factor (sigma-70 family)
MNETLSIKEKMSSEEYQERLARDSALCTRVQAGYTPAESTKETPRPRIVDGTLDDDAKDALGELFVHYENLTAKLAHKHNSAHNRTSADLNDLKQQGFFGIYHAAVTFNPGLDTSFTTHARITISSHLTKFINEHESLIRVPADVRGDIRRYGRTIWSTYQSQERMPSRTQIADLTGKTPAEVDRIAIAEAFTTQMGSIDEGYYTDGRDRKTTLEAGDGKWRSVVPGASEMRSVEDDIMVKAIVDIVQNSLQPVENGLSDKEIEIIKLRFFGVGEGALTLEEVGKILGITREAVRISEAKTLAKLRATPTRVNRLRDLITDSD